MCYGYNLDISSNHLNLPDTVIQPGSNNRIVYLYDAAGNKLRKKVLNDSLFLTGPFTGNEYRARFIATDGQPTSPDSTLLFAQDSIVILPGFQTQEGFFNAEIDPSLVTVDSTDYIGGIEYQNLPRGMAFSPAQCADSTGRGSIQAIYHPVGRAVPSGSNWRHEYIITDHLGNTRLQFSDLDGNTFIDSTEILDEITYYPFGSPWQDVDYRYTYNGKELDRELGLRWHHYGKRMFDPVIARFTGVDLLADKYGSLSPYAYVANNPINAIDPDGRYIIFIGGLRLLKGNVDQQKAMGGFKIHKKDVYNYWSTEKNTFGRAADISSYYQEKYNDNNVGFTSGSSHWNSQASQRREEGMKKAELFHSMVQAGEISLKPEETIKVVSHSQGGAHAAGYIEQLQSYTDAEGNPLYNIEVSEYITPHQPTDINHPEGVLGIQYSHPSDAVSSQAPWWLPNGGSVYGKINGINLFFGGDIMGGVGQPECGGPSGNRCGHNVTDNDEFIQQGGNQ